MNDYAKRNRNMVEFTPEKSKKIALARLDIVHKWLEFRKQSQNKLQADYDFVKLHNTSNFHLFEILCKISRGSLHCWYSMLNGTEDYTKLLPQYKYSSVDDYRTVLNDDEIKIFMGLLLHPNRLCIGKAIALTKYKLKEQGQSYIPADITFRKYANWFKKNNYDKWVLARDGEKALSDKVEPYIKRDASLLEVGDILVADGHVLNFNVINPFTGKPTRATLVGFLDWKSTALVGYEIMLEENTQCIASALRNSIINLDMIPKIVYQDNGRAFRAKYFTDDKGFTELGFSGLYSKLSIETVFARPYNARAKVIESRKRQNVDINQLDDLMLATEVKTIQRNGIRFLNCDYFDERLYGFKNKVLIKYNLFDLTSIKVYTTKGEYLCTAERVTETHPMAKLLGTVTDFEDYKQKIVKQRKLHKKTINAVKEYLSNDEVKYLETKMLEENSSSVQTEFKERSKGVQKIFKNNSEKYEYLIKNNPDDKWIEEFKQSKEYKLLYE